MLRVQHKKVADFIIKGWTQPSYTCNIQGHGLAVKNTGTFINRIDSK